MDESDRFPPGMANALKVMPLALPTEVVIRKGVAAIFPLTLEILQQFGASATAAGNAYLNDVRSLAEGTTPRQLNYSMRALEAFVSRRSRAVSLAQHAFELERTQLGDHFDPNSLRAREFAYILINETAALLGMWDTGGAADALVVASSALRSDPPFHAMARRLLLPAFSPKRIAALQRSGSG
jgi:hypothetical protein